MGVPKESKGVCASTPQQTIVQHISESHLRMGLALKWVLVTVTDLGGVTPRDSKGLLPGLALRFPANNRHILSLLRSNSNTCR